MLNVVVDLAKPSVKDVLVLEWRNRKYQRKLPRSKECIQHPEDLCHVWYVLLASTVELVALMDCSDVDLKLLRKVALL